MAPSPRFGGRVGEDPGNEVGTCKGRNQVSMTLITTAPLATHSSAVKQFNYLLLLGTPPNLPSFLTVQKQPNQSRIVC